MNPDLRSLIYSDLHRYHGRTSFKILLHAYWRLPAFRYTYHMRKARYRRNRRGLYNRAAFAFHKWLLLRARYRFGFQIPELTTIGRGFYIGHFGTVVVSASAVLGDNVNLGPGVVIGETARGSRAGVPVIGSRVWIGSNAVIVGKIRIGDGVVIAPGALVNFDVPENSVVVGNPGQIHSAKGSEGYIQNIA